ncbi:hypothetical protein OHA84_35260 [Streptomyces sp. NBC_00513]|uniref:hypothetical protein n=1 Tax=unclassified Streptomyces TaxID=2593676 RepID=UPI00225B3417|nr:hypothetical protein [Streptomyces sp. NBC_00424]MCX5071222.1 hypothetical protein [Streptomyces sp. NBC_00424]WUD45361.1 hypothetical protein OHA84_35260 [Streptomyces sp. NBC_00513]
MSTAPPPSFVRHPAPLLTGCAATLLLVVLGSASPAAAADWASYTTQAIAMLTGSTFTSTVASSPGATA